MDDNASAYNFKNEARIIYTLDYLRKKEFVFSGLLLLVIARCIDKCNVFY